MEFPMFRGIFGAFLMLVLMTSTLALTSTAQAAVWNDVNQWSPQWEARFAEWVHNEWQADFFARKTLPNGQNNPYQGLRLDCADTVYSMRLIFSYENHLPFIVQDPTASGKTISNKMSRFDNMNDTDRIRAFLRFIYDTTSTHSLPNDTFPVAISLDYIHSGGLMMTVAKNHHSWSMKDMLAIGVPYFVFNSTVGASSGSMLQQRQSWPNPDWVFEGDFTPAGNAGFRYWRPAESLNKPVWQTPGYSEEQYKIPLSKWVSVVQAKLAVNHETDQQLLSRLLFTACDGLKNRVGAVNDGLNFLRQHPACMNADDFETYSTPSRDHRVFDDLVALRHAFRQIMHTNLGRDVSEQMKAQLNKIFPALDSSIVNETRIMSPVGIDANSACVVEYSQGHKVDLADFKRRIFAGLISNNPNDDVSYRWGEARGPSQKAKSCPSGDSWTPDLNQD
jgi:hypothetical protein